YLEHGLVECEYNNLETRKFIKETSFEFYEWVKEDNLPIDTRIYKVTKYEEFISDNPDFKKWLTQRRFSIWLDVYAKYKNVKSLTGRDHINRWIEYIPLNEPDIPQKNDEVPF